MSGLNPAGLGVNRTFNTTEHEALDTGQSNIEPLKIGHFTDPHYGRTADPFVSSTKLSNKIDEFVTDMNNWGADLVVWGGDTTNEDSGSKSNSIQRIHDFRAEAEDPLNCPAVQVMGNHEHRYWDSYGEWSLDPWGFDSIDDTYFVAEDHHHAKVIVLNTGFRNDDTLQSGVPDGQLDWLREQLETTDKPVIPFTHTSPGLLGSVKEYDAIPPTDAGDYSDLFSEYNNISTVFSGHIHHLAHEHTSPKYNHSLTEPMDGWELFYQHFVHSLGGEDLQNTGSGDTSITPYAKIHAYQDGHIWVQQSYAGQNTAFDESFRYNSKPAPNPSWRETIDPLKYSVTDKANFGDGAYRVSAGTDSQVNYNTGGNSHYELVTSASGAEAWMRYRDVPPLVGDAYQIDWPAMILNVWVEMSSTDITGVTGQIGRGGRAGTSEPHIALWWANDNMFVSTGDGSGQGQQTIVDPYDSGDSAITQYQLRYQPHLGKVDVTVDNNGYFTLDSNVPPLTQSTRNIDDPTFEPLNQMFMRQTDDGAGASRGVKIYGWDLRLEHGARFSG